MKVVAIVYLFAKLASLCLPSVSPCLPSVSLTRMDLVWTSFGPRLHLVRTSLKLQPVKAQPGEVLERLCNSLLLGLLLLLLLLLLVLLLLGKVRFLGREARDFVWRKRCAMRLAQVLVKPRSRGLISCRPMARWGRCSLFPRANERKKDSRTTGQRTWMRFATVHSLSNIRIPKSSIPYQIPSGKPPETFLQIIIQTIWDSCLETRPDGDLENLAYIFKIMGHNCAHASWWGFGKFGNRKVHCQGSKNNTST